MPRRWTRAGRPGWCPRIPTTSWWRHRRPALSSSRTTPTFWPATASKGCRWHSPPGRDRVAARRVRGRPAQAQRKGIFDRSWTEIEVEIDGQPHRFPLTDSFWAHFAAVRYEVWARPVQSERASASSSLGGVGDLTVWRECDENEHAES